MAAYDTPPASFVLLATQHLASVDLQLDPKTVAAVGLAYAVKGQWAAGPQLMLTPAKRGEVGSQAVACLRDDGRLRFQPDL